MQENFFKGIITALVTPFKNEQIDFHSLENLLHIQITEGIQTIVIGGSTGEGFLLDKDEYVNLLQFVVNFTRQKNIKIISSCNAINHNSLLDMITIAKKTGVDGMMTGIPPYIRPSQDALISYFSHLNDKINIPLMLYAVPSRTGVNFTDETIISLSKLNNFYAIKDSTFNSLKFLNILDEISNNNMFILSGDDCNALAFYCNGAKGLVSVASNIYPSLVKDIYENFFDGKFKSALISQKKLLDIYKILNYYNNPVGIKYYMSLKKIINPEVKFPLISLNLKEQLSIKSIFNKRYLKNLEENNVQ